MLLMCLHKIPFSTAGDPFRVHVHVYDLVSVSRLGKNLHIKWWEGLWVLPKVMVHALQPSVFSSACSFASVQRVAGQRVILYIHTHTSPGRLETEGPISTKTHHSYRTLVMRDCLDAGIIWLFSLFSLVSLYYWPLDTGSTSILVPRAGSYQAALSSAEQCFFTLRRKSASLNICLTPWQLFDRTFWL